MKTMKKTFKKSMVLFTLLAAFAMIFTGCKKDSSSSSSGGGGGDNPPSGTYGKVTYGDNSFNVVAGGYYIDYDDDLQADYVAVALVDRTDGSDATKVFVVAIPFYSEMTTGTFNYVVEPSQEGDCMGAILANDDELIATSGSATITKNGEKYKIQSNGSMFDYETMAAVSFSVNFNGPLFADDPIAKLPFAKK